MRTSLLIAVRVVLFALATLSVPLYPLSVSSASNLAPPFDPPVSETALTDDPLFAKKCMAKFADAAQELGWRFGDSLLTRSESWGLVWRRDFRTKLDTGDSPLTNRVICWQPDGSDQINSATVFAHSLHPLNPTP